MKATSPFPTAGPSFTALRERVREHLRSRNRSEKGEGRAVAKALAILALFVASYVSLVFGSTQWWAVALSAFGLANGFVLIGFNIMHDGGHEAFSRHRWLNTASGLAIDLVGGSQWLWRLKHGHFHHTYTNLEGLDDDLDTNGILRLHREQPWRPWHRLQAYYALPLYSLLTVHWFISDFFEFFGRKIGQHEVRAPTRKDTVVFLLFKANFVLFAFVVPLLLHPWYAVLGIYLGVMMFSGMLMSLVFQLAHVVDGVEAPIPDAESGKVENEWMQHQLATTTDFAPKNRFLNWYLGGLNHQTVHHLFPRISHLRYAELAPVIAEWCRQQGLSYRSYPTFFAAVRAHFRQLALLGRGPVRT